MREENWTIQIRVLDDTNCVEKKEHRRGQSRGSVFRFSVFGVGRIWQAGRGVLRHPPMRSLIIDHENRKKDLTRVRVGVILVRERVVGGKSVEKQKKPKK